MNAKEVESGHPKQGRDAADGIIVRMMRRFILAILVFAMAGTFTDLMLFEHYKDAWQMIPLGLLGLAALTLIWHVLRGSAMSLRAFQIVMVLLLAGSIAGVILHSKASGAFQSEMAPAISRWQMAWSVLHSKVPPTLAPAGLMQMGLLGLAYTYRHPAQRRRGLGD